jgi:hypothetical protein
MKVSGAGEHNVSAGRTCKTLDVVKEMNRKAENN